MKRRSAACRAGLNPPILYHYWRRLPCIASSGCALGHQVREWGCAAVHALIFTEQPPSEIPLPRVSVISFLDLQSVQASAYDLVLDLEYPSGIKVGILG